MTQDILRKRARLLRDLVTLVLVVLVLVLLVEVSASIAGAHTAALLVERFPMLFYLVAIWTVRQAFASIARGTVFDRVVPQLIQRVGIALAAGALVNVFLVPWIWHFAFGGGGYAYYDVAVITLGVVGFALVLVARLLTHAADMREELDEMF